MKKIMTSGKYIFMLLLCSLLLPGCDIIIGIFQAGFWTAIFLVAVVVALVWYAVYKYRSDSGR